MQHFNLILAFPKVFLENGTSMEGRVVVEVNANTRGAVCADYFSQNEATVICRQYGYRDGVALKAGSHENENYFIEVMKCSGNETSFLDCLLVPDDLYFTCKSGAAAVKCYSNGMFKYY